ncbi:hypothetical protein TNCV_778881 [Trichonephila clavipes]|nr:hypothetical protein TNCV_778881 [Trichonephila clavipes]
MGTINQHRTRGCKPRLVGEKGNSRRREDGDCPKRMWGFGDMVGLKKPARMQIFHFCQSTAGSTGHCSPERVVQA